MRNVYSNEILPLFKKKGVREECECCGHDNWIIHNNFSGLVHQVAEESSTLFNFPVVVLECQNCGNMRFFSRSTLGIQDERTDRKG